MCIRTFVHIRDLTLAYAFLYKSAKIQEDERHIIELKTQSTKKEEEHTYLLAFNDDWLASSQISCNYIKEKNILHEIQETHI